MPLKSLKFRPGINREVTSFSNEGGYFEFFGKEKVNSKRGTVIVFPSYKLHRVKPVTEGTRYSLVTWFCGESFR